ncbi:MAG: hypothetical protein AAF942_17820, partial [Pseudomonadota bacterium]
SGFARHAQPWIFGRSHVAGRTSRVVRQRFHFPHSGDTCGMTPSRLIHVVFWSGLVAVIACFVAYQTYFTPSARMERADVDELIAIANDESWERDDRREASNRAMRMIREMDASDAETDARLVALRGSPKHIRDYRSFVRYLELRNEEARNAAAMQLFGMARLHIYPPQLRRSARRAQSKPSAPGAAASPDGKAAFELDPPRPVDFVAHVWRTKSGFFAVPPEGTPRADPRKFQGIPAFRLQTPTEIKRAVDAPGRVAIVVHSLKGMFSTTYAVNGSPINIPCGTAYRHDAEIFIFDFTAGKLERAVRDVTGPKPPLRKSKSRHAKGCSYVGGPPELLNRIKIAQRAR